MQWVGNGSRLGYRGCSNSTCTFLLTGGFDDNYSLDTCERYSPKTQKWESVFRLSCPRGGVGLAALGGRLYAVGGHDGKNYLNSVEAYDPITDRLVSGKC